MCRPVFCQTQGNLHVSSEETSEHKHFKVVLLQRSIVCSSIGLQMSCKRARCKPRRLPHCGDLSHYFLMWKDCQVRASCCFSFALPDVNKRSHASHFKYIGECPKTCVPLAFYVCDQDFWKAAQMNSIVLLNIDVLELASDDHHYVCKLAVNGF